MPLPEVAICPTRMVAGANNLTDPVQGLEVLGLGVALMREWATDAHFLTYQVREPGGSLATSPDDDSLVTWPRCNSPMAAKVRAVGGDIRSTMIVLDYDNPGHAQWTASTYQAFLSLICGTPCELLRDFTAFYTTLHGARFIWVLDESVPVEQGALIHKALVVEFAKHGVAFDRTCADWTRLFRLPRVRRDDKATSAEPYFEMVEQFEKRLPVASVKPLAVAPGLVKAYGIIERIDSSQPTIEDAEGIVWEVNPSTGARGRTKWFKEAERRLKGRSCAEVIFGLAPIAASGSRDHTLLRLVGEAISLLYYLAGSSPEAVYALFLESVMQMDPDAGTPDWSVNLWDKVCRIWAREKAKATAAADLETQYVADAMTLTNQVLQGMRRWCDHPTLHGPDTQAIEWMARRLICCYGSHCYVMTRTGCYDTIPVYDRLLLARVRELGMENLLPVEKLRADGKGLQPVTPSSLIARHGTIVQQCEGRAGGEHAAVVRNIGAENATLVVRMFRRSDELGAIYDQEVDAWLLALAGSAEAHVRLCDWIGHALAIEDGPICALSIAGPRGVGKKLLVQGLAECFSSGRVADAKEFGQFQSALMVTPIVSINEGFPANQSGANDPADTFRQIVGGDPITINEKYKPTVTIRNPARVVFTANNRNVVKILAGKRELSADDRAALAQRLLHLDVGPKASAFFAARGGASYTARPGARWITGDSGQTSDYVVARHFLWLYGIRNKPRFGSRLLVEGGDMNDLLREMVTQTASAPGVIETLCKMVESNNRQGITVVQGRVFVLPQPILEAYRGDVGKRSRGDLTIAAVHAVLGGLEIPGGEQTLRKLTGSTSQARWYEIDPGMLLAEAHANGLPCSKLEGVIASRVKAAA